ncbi:MAG TPA: alpha/beta hydrolase [Ktedonobacterales bacterium]|nr:alpha/beta hydrolase [Ktedonobacterales bacterium]
MGQESAPASSDAPAQVRIAERGIVVNGLRIATAMSDAPRHLLARAPLVVLPAAGHVWADYRSILDRFALDRRVFALDWPGFGNSQKPALAAFRYTAEGYAELLSGWLDGLGIARAVLLGNSVGGAAAIRYAAANPRRVVGLALVAPSGFTSPGMVRTLATRLLGTPAILRRVEPALTSLYLGPATPETRYTVAAHRVQRFDKDYPALIQAYAALWRSFNRPDADLTEVARQVTAPVIVVRGALDPIFTAGDARRAAESLGERGALEVVLPGAGHLPFLQQPERFAQAVAGLIETAEARAVAEASK